MKKDVYGKFYNPNKILSYGKVLNFSIGSRSIGKSTGWALFLLLEWINKGRQFIYVRRTRDELHETCVTYFDNAVDILKHYGYKIEEFYYKGGCYYMNGELCGYAIPLGLQQKYKSSNYSKVWWILYDEFMIMPGTKSTYLGGSSNSMLEVDAMVSLFQTVDRGVDRAFRDECRIIFIGNAGTFFNPFFINYGIDRFLRPETKFLCPKQGMYVLESTAETEATKDIKNSNGYKISTEKTKSYAYDNNYSDISNDRFISKPPKSHYKALCNFIYDGQTYGLYSYPEEGFIYVSHKECLGKPALALTMSDHSPNYLMIRTWHGHPLTQLLKRMYDVGSIRFNDFKCKMVVDFYLAYDV